MAYDYSKFRSLAARLIARFGQPVTVTFKSGEPVYNAATATAAPAETTVNANVLFKRGSKGASARTLASMLQFGEWDVVMAAEQVGTLPKAGDYITRDGVKLVIAESDEARPATVGIVYFCRLQK